MDAQVYFRAPSNIEDEHCDICGNLIRAGEVIVENPFGTVIQFAHESCVEAREQDMREEGAA
jgi:hypothetical protein